MNYWELRPDSDNYNSLLIKDKRTSYSDIVDLFSENRRLTKDWVPIIVRSYNNHQMLGDFPSLFAGTPPVFSAKAANILSPLINNTVEILPLEYPEEQYFVVNVEIVDCLDQSNSEIERFGDGNRIKHIKSYSFRRDRLKGIHIFRIPELVVSRTFVSTRFKDLATENNLEGVLYKRTTDHAEK